MKKLTDKFALDRVIGFETEILRVLILEATEEAVSVYRTSRSVGLEVQDITIKVDVKNEAFEIEAGCIGASEEKKPYYEKNRKR